MANFRLGYEGVLYFGTGLIEKEFGAGGAGDTFADVAWNELDNVMDVDDTFESDKVDTTTRAEAKKGWASEINTTKKGTFKFTMRWKPGDAGFEMLRNAWLANSEVALLDLDGPFGAAENEGNQGFVGNFTVSFGIKRPVKGIQTVEVTASLSSLPDWAEVNSSGDLIAA